jgi:hypothetical protein
MITVEQLKLGIKRQIKAFGSAEAYARHIGIHHQHLHDCKNGRRKPSRKLLKALNLAEVRVYVKTS